MKGSFLALERRHDRLIEADADLDFEPGDIEADERDRLLAQVPRSRRQGVRLANLVRYFAGSTDAAQALDAACRAIIIGLRRNDPSVAADLRRLDGLRGSWEVSGWIWPGLDGLQRLARPRNAVNG